MAGLAGATLSPADGGTAADLTGYDGGGVDSGPSIGGLPSSVTAPGSPLAVVNGPDISYSNLQVDTTSIPAGSAVEVTATVTNNGGSSQPYEAALQVDGEVVAWENGTLGGGGRTTTVRFTKTLWDTGNRSITIEGLPATTVTVRAANAKFHGGPANLGYYPNQSGPLSHPVEAWSITDGTPQVMQSTIVDGTLYTAFHDGGKLYALDPETGAELWNATPGGASGSTWTTPAYANGVLYLGTNDYKLHAVDASNGSEIWNYSTNTNVRSAPAVVDGVVYFAANEGNVTALNATTGAHVWTYQMYQPVLVESNPAVVDGVVYVGGDDDNVTALNATDGSVVWRYQMIDQSQSDATVAQDTVYIGGDSTAGETSGTGQVYALNATDGTVRWNYSMAGDVDGSPVYADGTVYAGSRGGDLVALDATTGTKLWNVTGSDFRGAPVVAGDVLYLSDFGNASVHAFNATTGAAIWQYASPTGNLYPTPLAWNGYLYYGSGSHFYALEQGAPVISNLNATNPSGQDVAVTFQSDRKLVNLSVSVTGAETTTLTEGDFTESGTGPYTYGAVYPGSSDGTYTVTVATAEDAEGADGASGQNASVTVDTVPPTISNVSVANPSGQNVSIGFDSSEQLATIGVGISGAEWASLDRSNFTETGSGPYTYTALYEGNSNGTYTATLYAAQDSAGNEGASSESDSVAIGTAVVASSIEYVSGSQPDMANVTLDAWFSGGLLQVQAKNATANVSDFSTENDYELAGLGADDTTVLRIDLTVQKYTPRALVGSAHDVTWTRTNNGDGTWNVSIEGTPAAVESYFESDGSSPTTWPGTYQANESQDAAMTFAVDDLGVMSPTYRERLNGSIMATDAQEFGSPRYNDTGATDRIELRVKAPHFAKDGSNNTGFFEAFLPQKLLDDWGVNASELAGEFDGTSRNTTVQTVSGGVRVDFGIHYSAGDAAITVDTTAPSAEAGTNLTTDEDTLVAFDGTASTDNVGITSYEWNFGDGTNATGATPTHTYADPGTYTVTLTAEDAAGNTATDTLTATVEDTTAPTAIAGPDRTVDEDTSVGFDGSNSTDNVGVTNYEWAFGDGSANATGATPTHTYADPGTYTVTLTVADAAGNTATDTLTATVEDTTAPTADAGPDVTVDEDTAVAFDGTASTDNVGITSYEWAFGDGSANATGSTPTHTYADPGTYTVTLTVEDAAGNTATDTLTVTVTDTTPPTVDVGLDRLATENEPLNFTASVSDASAIANVTWTFGDGATDAGPTVTHAYGSSGSYNVTATVTDAAGNSASDSLTVGIGPARMVITGTSVSPTRMRVGDLVTVTVRVTNEGNSTGTKRIVGRADGTELGRTTVTLGPGESTTERFIKRFDRAGTYDVRVNSRFVDRLRVDAPANVAVRNASLSPTAVTLGNATTVTATVGNDGTLAGNATLTVTVDGTTVATPTVSVPAGSTVTTSVDYTPAAVGTYTVAVDGVSAGTLSVSDPSNVDDPDNATNGTANLSVQSASLSPASVVLGNATTVTAAVENTGDADGATTLNLTSNGTAVDTRTVSVPANATTSANFTYAPASAGTYVLAVDGVAAGTLSVSDPGDAGNDSDGNTSPGAGPRLQVVDASLSLPTVTAGNTTTVTVTVENRGTDAGTTTLTLSVDGTPVANRSVSVLASDTLTVDFDYTPAAAGTYDLAVENVSAGQLTVTAGGNGTGGNATLPANVTVTNVSLSATAVQAGDTVDVTVTLANTGDRDGSALVTLTANGTIVADPMVSVPGRSTVTTTLPFARERAGRYVLAVDGDRVGTVTVTRATNGSGPPLVFGTRPTDPDADGVYEDLDADGNVTLIDVTILYNNYGSPTFQSNARFFDVNGDGRLDLIDVTVLYGRVTGSP